jgi:hypothetical protein
MHIILNTSITTDMFIFRQKGIHLGLPMHLCPRHLSHSQHQSNLWMFSPSGIHNSEKNRRNGGKKQWLYSLHISPARSRV